MAIKLFRTTRKKRSGELKVIAWTHSPRRVELSGRLHLSGNHPVLVKIEPDSFEELTLAMAKVDPKAAFNALIAALQQIKYPDA